MPKTLVIIPTYNEETTIEKLVTTLFELNLGLDIMIVDDGRDQTESIIKRLQSGHSNLYLIKRLVKSGRGTAVLEGLRFGLRGGYELMVEMDADFSHNPEELPELLKLAGPNNLVIGSRYLRGSKIDNWPLSRRIFSRFANFYANMILKIGIHDYTNGYRVYGRQAILGLDMDSITSKGYIVLSEIAYRLFKQGATIVERPTHFVNRVRGQSSFSFKEVKEAFTSVIKLKKRVR